jgi:hypothetical protein
MADNAELVNDPAALQKMWQVLGKQAQRSMMSSFGQLVTAREGPIYRVGENRLAGGVLRSALGRSDFFSATAEGLDWGNIDILNTAARDWHRIAFGAGGRGSGINTQYQIDFEGMLMMIFGIDQGPSPGFGMPEGQWFDAGEHRQDDGARGTGIFYPGAYTKEKYVGGKGAYTMDITRGRKAAAAGGAGASAQGVGMHPTAGISTHDFFSAGLRRIAQELPAALGGYEQDVLGRLASSTNGTITRVVRITPKVRPSWRN